MTHPEKRCFTCQYCGMDMDMEPYCVHPEVKKRAPYGQTLSSLNAPTRPGKECEDFKLWEPRTAWSDVYPNTQKSNDEEKRKDDVEESRDEEKSELKKCIEGTVADLVSNFLYYDRKEDEELPMGAIEAAVEAGEVSVAEITEMFRAALVKGLKGG